MKRYSEADLDALKSRNPVFAVAGDWVRLRARRGGKFTHSGPCPICSRDPDKKAAGRFECNADTWVCAVCSDGGDVIRLMQKREGIDFNAAVERLGGERGVAVTPVLAERAGVAAFQRGASRDDYPADYDGALIGAFRNGYDKAQRQDAANVQYRDRERRRLYAMWQRGAAWRGSPVESYLRNRGVDLPDNAKIRFLPDACLFADGREDNPVLLHKGPAMIAAIIGANGRFAGLHFTWLDPNGPKGKALIFDHTIGENAPSKKSRGSKKGGYIDLGGCPANVARVMISGEGIETCGAVYVARRDAGRDLSETNFRCGIDLGNLAGKAIETVPHPTLKTKAGRVQRVPGPDPDMTSPAMPVPENVAVLILLGDGDSDPYTTRNALLRAKVRHSREGRAVWIATADDDRDFNEMLGLTNGNDHDGN